MALNSNIRCIEISVIPAPNMRHATLNSNIRCIEMILTQTQKRQNQR